MKRYSRAIHLFRRDLRLEDNTALNAALESAEEVVLLFVIDPRQAGKSNAYRGDHFLQFLAESLEDVHAAALKFGGALHIYEGNAEEVILDVTKETKAEAVFFNKDYTPFALERDSAIKMNLEKQKVAVHSYDDTLVNPPGTVLTSEARPYSVFTPFYRSSATKEVSKPVKKTDGILVSLKLGSSMEAVNRLAHERKTLATQGGRKAALKTLEKATDLSHYKTSRDMVAESGTTLLSPYHKLGCISVRETYWTLRNELPHAHELLTRQLYWRDFFTHLIYFHPGVLGAAFKPSYDRIKWDDAGEKFVAWKEGKTGFPIVDAGMRQLNESGWMHNRARMITASFLTKDLHIDWREGEKYFAQQLIDYDPAVNNGSWQWVAGTGADAAPYFRIFNPWLQQKKFDPDCVYIKKWIPELRDIPTDDIHRWEEVAGGLFGGEYPAPMLNHREEAEETKRRFGRALK